MDVTEIERFDGKGVSNTGLAPTAWMKQNMHRSERETSTESKTRRY